MAIEPKVSVVIPLYNKGRYIARAINSVLEQTFQDFEVIVIYRHSTDDSANVVNNFQDRRIKMVPQKGHGVSEGRNQGIELARGEIVAFLDADDEWQNKHLETIFRLFITFPEAGAYATAYKIHSLEGTVGDPIYFGIPAPPWEGLLPNYFLSATPGYNPIITSVLCLKKEITSVIGMFRPGFSYGEDMDLIGRIAMRYPIAFSWEVGVIYYEDSEDKLTTVGLTSSSQEPFIIAGREAILNREVPEDMVPFILDYINKLELNRAERIIKLGDYKQARELILSCDTELLRSRKIKLLILTLMPPFIFKQLWKLKRNIFQKVFGFDYSNDPWFKD